MIDVKLKNLGTKNKNALVFSKDGRRLEVFFSYETIVAFKWAARTVCSKNEWSTTTGKLLNEVQPDKMLRIPSHEVRTLLDLALTEFFS